MGGYELHQQHATCLTESWRLQQTILDLLVEIRVQVTLKTPSALDSIRTGIIFYNRLIFFHRLSSDYKPTADETVWIACQELGGTFAIVDFDSMFVDNGVPFSSFGFIDQTLQIRMVMTVMQFFTGFLLEIVCLQTLGGDFGIFQLPAQLSHVFNRQHLAHSIDAGLVAGWFNSIGIFKDTLVLVSYSR